MKKIFIGLLAFAAAMTASAQDIFDNPDNHAYFGVRASYELSAPGDIDMGAIPAKIDALGNSSGFSVGAIYNMPLWKNLYFEPGAAIYYNTYSIDKDVASLIFPIGGDERIKSASVRQWGVRIPLHVGYNFDFTPDIRVALFTGPEVNISFKGNTHAGVDEFNVSGPAFGDKGYLNRCDIKWRIGVGATLSDHYYVAVSGAIGMCDMMHDRKVTTEDGVYKTNWKMHSNLFDITLGYNF